MNPVEREPRPVECEAWEEVGVLGDEIYLQIRDQVEPAHSGAFIAIHVDTDDYAIAKTSSQAVRSLLARHAPDGRIHVQRIGPEPDSSLEYRTL